MGIRNSRHFVCALVIAAAVFAIPAPASAQEVQYLGSHGGEQEKWHTFFYMENDNRVCFMASQPLREEGNYTQRGEVYVHITHRPADGSRDVVSFTTGYTYQSESIADVRIGNDNFRLFTHQDTAWAPDEETDRALVQAMRGGANMVVSGTSSRGTDTSDTYTLMGFTAAHNELLEACP